MNASDNYFGSHEIQQRKEEIKGSSDRGFGVVFAVVFALISCSSWYSGGHNWPWWFGGSALFGLIALTVPKVLAPLNVVWMRFGLLLSAIVSPVMLAFLFYLCIMPTGLLLRLFGKDLLNLEWRPEAQSYWIDRTPPGPNPDTLTNQF